MHRLPKLYALDQRSFIKKKKKKYKKGQCKQNV